MNRKSNGIIIVFLLGLLIIASATAVYYYWQSQQFKDAQLQIATQSIQINSPKLIKSGSEIVSIDDKTNKYVNHDYGFSIKYPKYQPGSSSCEQINNNTVIPLKVFEDSSENTLYISGTTFMEMKNKQVSGGGWQSDVSTCKVLQNSLSLIKEGFDNGMPDPMGLHANISKPNALQFNYQRINSNSDLQSLAQSIYKGCFPGKKQLVKGSTSTYQVRLVDNSGQNNPNGGCFANFLYFFLYSPTDHVAVITSGFQNPPFNGTNGQYEPEIEFTNL